MVNLQRNTSTDEGTFGILTTDSSFKCHTGELPNRNNEPNTSCIPTGIYIVSYRFSAKHGMCYHVNNVLNRSDVEIHSANWMGDLSKGYKSQLLGCIAPGLDLGELDGQMAMLNSKKALLALETALNKEPFTLTIK